MKSHRLAITSVLTVALVSGCGSMQTAKPPNIPVTAVIEQLKYEIAAFSQETNGKSFTFAGGPRCGSSGEIKMSVKSIEVKLTAEITNTGGVNASLSAPIPAGGITLGPTGGISNIVDNSQIITLNFTPYSGSGLPPPKAVTVDPAASLTIARALIGLRDQLLAVRNGGQCLNFTAPNTISLAFTAEKDLSGGIKFNLIVFSLDTTVTQKAKSGNTITVALDFTGSGAMAPQPEK